jgi:hypothetical protein
MITFATDPTLPVSQQAPIYVVDDYALTSDPRPTGCTLSLALNEVELRIDEESERLVFVEGYCPYFEWIPRSLTVPDSRRVALVAVFDEKPMPGIPRGLPVGDRWSVYADRTSGWICFGEPLSPGMRSAFEFSPRTIAVLGVDNSLRELWIRPMILQQEILDRLKDLSN